ncbi:hypothetical protein [Aminipila sp.]|uniref:hypothetical protein n=1 Tax=Aminipila sp. TaxID=2060095 RepID=UPI00289B843A|nr:hypothetical protein [Aminipila sp.]
MQTLVNVQDFVDFIYQEEGKLQRLSIILGIMATGKAIKNGALTSLSKAIDIKPPKSKVTQYTEAIKGVSKANVKFTLMIFHLVINLVNQHIRIKLLKEVDT